MSYDWRIVNNTPIEDWIGTNLTWNVLPMYYLAIRRTCKELVIHSFSELHGRQAKELIEPFSKMLADMKRYQPIYEELSPKNGWGNYESAIGYLKKMRDACMLFPEGEYKIR